MAYSLDVTTQYEIIFNTSSLSRYYGQKWNVDLLLSIPMESGPSILIQNHFKNIFGHCLRELGLELLLASSSKTSKLFGIQFILDKSAIWLDCAVTSKSSLFHLFLRRAKWDCKCVTKDCNILNEGIYIVIFIVIPILLIKGYRCVLANTGKRSYIQ